MMSLEPYEQKVWGSTRCDCFCAYYSHHTLRVKAGGICSVHYHQHRLNQFKIVSGRIVIVELYAWKAVRTVLGPKDVYSVPSLVPHQFQALCDSQMVEEYMPDRGGRVERDDIVRLTQGFRTNNLPLLREQEGAALIEDFTC